MSSEAWGLTADVSKNEVSIAANFTGEKLLLFGAIDRVLDAPAPDIIVIVRGPREDIVMRRKGRWGFIWLNRDSYRLGLMPTFYAVASTRALGDFVPEPERMRFKIGAAYLTPLGGVAPPEEGQEPEAYAYRKAFLRLQQAQGIYSEVVGSVQLIDGQLFRTEIDLPSLVPLGQYNITFLVVRDGRVIGRTTRMLEVGYSGIAQWLRRAAFEASLFYGLGGVLIGALMGISAARIFRRV